MRHIIALNYIKCVSPVSVDIFQTIAPICHIIALNNLPIIYVQLLQQLEDHRIQPLIFKYNNKKKNNNDLEEQKKIGWLVSSIL